MVARQLQLLALLAVAQSISATITASQVKAATAAASNAASEACVSGLLLSFRIRLCVNHPSIPGWVSAERRDGFLQLRPLL